MAKQISPFYSADSKVNHIYGSCSAGKSVKKRKKGTRESTINCGEKDPIVDIRKD